MYSSSVGARASFSSVNLESTAGGVLASVHPHMYTDEQNAHDATDVNTTDTLHTHTHTHTRHHSTRFIGTNKNTSKYYTDDT